MVTSAYKLKHWPPFLARLQFAVLSLVVLLALIALGMRGWMHVGPGALAAHGSEAAWLWRLGTMVLPAVLTAAISGRWWWKAQQSPVRIAALLILMSALGSLALALWPLRLDTPLDPINAKAGLAYALWWLSGTAAAVVAAFGLKKPIVTVIAALLVGLAGLQISGVLNLTAPALVGWLQLLLFALGLDQWVRVTYTKGFTQRQSPEVQP